MTSLPPVIPKIFAVWWTAPHSNDIIKAFVETAVKNADIDEDAGKKVVAQLCYLFDEKTARQVLDGRLSEKM